MNKILAIAIDEYDDPEIKNLKNCVSDLSDIVELLTSEYQFDDLEFIHKKEETTGENIHSVLISNLVHAMEGDSLLILFAGHGEYNSATNTSYWQVSDSLGRNPVSWFNISEILQMLKVSPADHICIVSDSCFSGAIFEPEIRGGGITAFESKKSRIALTSGGLEPVSDGEEGTSSPFAKTFMKQLQDNTREELPFNILAQEVLLDFSSGRKQTPKFGGLLNVGHDGGSLILRRRNDEVESHKKDLQELQSALATLTIDNDKIEKEIIEQIEEVKLKKNEVIRSQQYEAAAELRDSERKLLESLDESISIRLEEVYKSSVSENSVEGLGKDIDDSFENYAYSREKARELYEEIKKEGVSVEEADELGILLIGEEYRYRFAAENALEELKKTDPKITLSRINPNKQLWEENRSLFVKELSKGVIELMMAFGVATAGANNIQIRDKKETLKRIIVELHNLQRQAQFDKYEQSFDDLVKRKNLEVELLNWLREI